MDALLLACAKEGTRAEALEAAAEEANDATDRDAVDPRKGRSRATWSTFQIAAMSKFYESSPFPSAREREALAKAIDLPQRQVQTWFQNRRQRNKDPTSIRPRGVDAQRLLRNDCLAAGVVRQPRRNVKHHAVNHHHTVTGLVHGQHLGEFDTARPEALDKCAKHLLADLLEISDLQ